MNKKHRAQKILTVLKKTFPQVKPGLKFNNALQLLIATILSAQCTDLQVNKVTPILFSKFKTASDFAKANSLTLEKIIRSTGFFKNKAKSIKNCCKKLVEKYDGAVPSNMEALVDLPGVGRKTANVVLGNYFKIPGLVVDTHVIRISNRLELTKFKDPEKIEFDLHPLFPPKEWAQVSLLMQAHGRKFCIARSPKCSICPIVKYCPFYVS